MGLGIAAEILCAVLSSGRFGEEQRERGGGQIVQAVDIEHFQPLSEFTARMDRMVEYLKSSRVKPGSPGVFIPGELECAAPGVRAHGDPLDQPTRDCAEPARPAWSRPGGQVGVRAPRCAGKDPSLRGVNSATGVQGPAGRTDPRCEREVGLPAPRPLVPAGGVGVLFGPALVLDLGHGRDVGAVSEASRMWGKVSRTMRAWRAASGVSSETASA